MHHFLLADDHPLFRDALSQLIKRHFADAEILQAADVASCFALLAAHAEQIDLLFLDLSMPGARGYSALIALRAQYPGLPILVISGRSDPLTVARALAHGAAGFVAKHADHSAIHGAIERVLRGELVDPVAHGGVAVAAEERALAQQIQSLTPAQFRVLLGLCDGQLNKQIAFDLGITEATVKAHVTVVLRKLGVHHRTQLLARMASLAVDTV